MDDEQAKFFLSAGQPSGRDANAPEMAEALRHAQSSPELAAWLAAERRSDAAIARKVRQLEPPPELRARILAGGRASRRATRWRRWQRPLAIAAALTVTAGVAWSVRRALAPTPVPPVTSVATLQTWQERCVGIFSSPLFSLDREDHDYAPLKAHLRAQGAPVFDGTPPFSDAIIGAVGCKILDWQGSVVSLTCFRADSGELVHLFVTTHRGVDESLGARAPYRNQVGAYATVTWHQGDKIVMVASLLSAAKLERVLQSGRAAAVTSPTRRG
jgi:hypothetical protein